MRKLTLAVCCATLVFHLPVFCQSKSEQIRQLQKIAQDNETRAKKAEEQAEKYNRVAQDAQREEERQRYLLLAATLSQNSVDADDQRVAGLLALQAYNYQVKFKGNEFDRNIYQGLLSALVRFDSGCTKLTGHTRHIRAFISKPDMAAVLAAEEDGRVLRWGNENGEWTSKELMPTKDGFAAIGICVRQDGRLWILGRKTDAAGRVGIYDITFSSKKIEGIHDLIKQISFLPEASNYYALSSSGHSIFYGDPQQGKEVVRLGEKITLIDVSRDGGKLAAVTSAGNLYVWDIKKDYSRSIYKVGDELNQITTMAFTPLGRDVVMGDAQGKINILTVPSGAVRKMLSMRSPINAVAFSNLGNLMAVADKSGVIRIWVLTDLNRWPLTINERTPIGSLTFSPDGSEIMSATLEKQPSIHVWPLTVDAMAKRICRFLPSNMSTEEWDQYVGLVPYEQTCPQLPPNNR